MDNSQTQTRKTLFKCHKKRLTQDQVNLLENSFNVNNKLDPDSKSQLAQQLGLPPRQISIWYQNRRARGKNQNLEDNHKALSQRLENVAADNQRLRREVDRLKEELHKAQEMLQLLVVNNNTNTNTNNNTYINNSSLSSSCDEVGSLSLLHHDDSKELYACLLDDHDESQFIGTTSADFHNFFAST